MAKSVFVQLTIAGDDTGPTYNVFAINGVGVHTTLDSQVPQANLLAGVTYTTVPDDAVIIKVCSHDNKVCTNCVEIPIVGITTSTTSTSSTTITTTTEAPVSSEVFFTSIINEEGYIGVTPVTVQTYYLYMTYEITAYADNYENTSLGRSNTVKVESTINYGASWVTQDSVVATAVIGSANSDTKTKTGFFILGPGLSLTPSSVRVRITGDCGSNGIGAANTEGYVTISDVIPDVGIATVAATSHTYNAECDGTVIDAALS